MSGIPDTLAGLAVDIDQLEAYPGNARRGDLSMIVESLRVNGQYRPVVVNRRNNQVLAGNHTVQAARELGWPQVAATFVDATDEEARRIVLIDNRANDVAGYDDGILAELLADLDGNYEGTGFDDNDLDDLLASLGGGFGGKDKDAAPPRPDTAITQPGDLIILGRHRLICASALDTEAVDRLTEGALADLVLTDPPYMVDYGDAIVPDGRGGYRARRRGGTSEIANDTLAAPDADAFVHDAMRVARDTLKPGGSYYVFCPPGPDMARFITGLRAARMEPRETIIWVKDSFVFGRQDYHWRHEPALYGWREGSPHFFIDDRKQDTVWEFDRPRLSKEHPTMKPVAMLERMIENSSRAGETVIDLFAGSGSTLIACESVRRSCLAVELDPGYCDVIVARWEQLTGQSAVRPSPTVPDPTNQ